MNDREHQMIQVQPMRAKWEGVVLVHVPQHQTPQGYSDDPSSPAAIETVRYEALVLQVELYRGNRLAHGSESTLARRGWGLLVEEEEQVAFLHTASHKMQRVDAWGGGGT